MRLSPVTITTETPSSEHQPHPVMSSSPDRPQQSASAAPSINSGQHHRASIAPSGPLLFALTQTHLYLAPSEAPHSQSQCVSRLRLPLPLPRDRSKLSHLTRLNPAFLRTCNNLQPPRDVHSPALNSPPNAVALPCSPASVTTTSINRGLPSVKRSRLVHHQRVDLLQRLQRLSVPNQNRLHAPLALRRHHHRSSA